MLCSTEIGFPVASTILVRRMSTRESAGYDTCYNYLDKISFLHPSLTVLVAVIGRHHYFNKFTSFSCGGCGTLLSCRTECLHIRPWGKKFLNQDAGTFSKMIPYRRLVPTFKSCVFSVARPVASTSYVMQRRGLISSVPRRAGMVETGEQASSGAMDEDSEFREILTQQRGNDTGPTSYRQFLEEIGYKYKLAAPGLWLGNKVVEFVSWLLCR